MACLDKAQKRVREILKENGYDMRTKVAKEVEHLATRMLHNVNEVIPDSKAKEEAKKVVYRIRKSLENGTDGAAYWDSAIRKFISGRTVTISNPDGGQFLGKVSNSVLTVDGILNLGIEGKNGKIYDYNIDPNTGKTENGTTINELKNVYALMTNEFGSNDAIVVDDTRFDLLENDLNNDIRKARNLMDELDTLDRIDIDESHKNHLNKVVEMFVDSSKEFIPQMKVYLDQTARENGGVLRFRKNRGSIYLQAGDRQKQFAYDPSIREVFAHEVVHSSLEFGREYNRAAVSSTMSRVKRLHRQFFKQFKPEDLIPENSPYGRDIELENATKLYNYMRGEKGLAEFLAHGITNPQVIAKLKELDYYEGASKTPENMFEKVTFFIEEMLDKIFAGFRKESGQKGDELLLKFALDMAESNNRATYHAKRGLTTKALEGIDEGNKLINKLIDKGIELIKSGADNVPTYDDIGNTRRERAVWLMRNLGRFITDKNLRPLAENYMSEVMGSLGRPEGTIQTLIRNFRTPDKLQRIVERFARLSNEIDNIRDTHKNSIARVMLDGFQRELTKEEDSALGTVVIENDLSSIGHYSINKIAGLLTNDEVLAREIDRVKEVVRQRSARHPDSVYYNNMAKKLGQFIATGRGDELTLLNARNIARKLNDISPQQGAVNEDLVKAIDELATLYGLRYTQAKPKQDVSELISEDPNGVRAVILMQQGLKKASNDILDADKVFEVKGYGRDVTNDRIDVKIDFVSNTEALENEGYKRVKDLKKYSKDESRGEMALFIGETYGVQSHNRVSLRLTDEKKMGTSLRDIYKASEGRRGRAAASLNIEKIKLSTEKKVSYMHRKEIPDNVDDGMIPLLDEEGNVVDYRYMMPKDRRAKYLDRDNRASIMLGKGSASIYDKLTTHDFNLQVVDEMIKDRDENYINDKYGRNDKEYVVVGAKSDEKEIRELWAILPKKLKIEIEDRTGSKGIAVRRDLLYSYFGFRDVSALDNDALNNSLNKTWRTRLKIAESIWKEIVAISKIDIVIKTPAVLIGNVVSNFMLSIQLGMNPADVAKFQLDGVRELREYRKDFRELHELRVKDQSGLGNADIRSKIKFIEGKLEKSPVRDLIDEGLFQSIIEDVNPDSTQANSKIETSINEYLQDKHKFVREGFNWLYLTERNPVYKTMLTGTQYSDFVARYSLYQAYRIKGIPKKTAVERVNDAFINYGIPDSKALQYLNDLGFVMFTKYFLRIQRVIKEGVQDKPLNFFLALIGQEYLLGDVEDVMDQSIFDKDLGNIVHQPLEHLKNLVVPSGAQILDTLIADPLIK